MTVTERLRKRIETSETPVLLKSDFKGLGSPTQISRSLTALIAEGALVRIGLGLYAQTRRSSVTGVLVPVGSLETLATAALQRLGIEVTAGRAAQAYNNGETTQLPGVYVAHTGMRRISRVIVVGGRQLIYEHE